MPEDPLHNPHDHFFKHAFGRPDAAAGFFKEYLPPELAVNLDWERLERKEGTFVDETLSERHSDLLFTVPWNDRNVLLYCLFEHQSSEDRWMPLRLLRYMVRIWDAQLGAEPGRGSLSPILPVVLHQSDRTWKPSNRFRSLLEMPGGSIDDLAGFIPDFGFRLVDLADMPIEDLRGSVLVRAILATMKAAKSGEWDERVEELAPLLSGALRKNDLAFVQVCLAYVFRESGEVDFREFHTRLDQLDIGELKEDIMTLGEQLIQEGRKEGRLQTLRENIQDIVEARFGEVPGEVRDTLKGIADETRLKALHRRAALAGSLDEFRGDL